MNDCSIYIHKRKWKRMYVCRDSKMDSILEAHAYGLLGRKHREIDTCFIIVSALRCTLAMLIM